MYDRSCAPARTGDPRHERLGAAIRAARLPLTQVELAAMAGVPQSSISLWENSRTAPSTHQIHRLEQVLDLPAGQLLLAAGYIDTDFCASVCRSDGPARQVVRWRPGPGTPARFPERVFAWLEEFRPVIDTICTLRSTAYDDHALHALLDSNPVTQLRLGWEIWEATAPEAADDPGAAMGSVIGRTALNQCRYALFGITSLRSVPALAGSAGS